MTLVYDSEGNEIGRFDGRFVYNRTGERIYWIDDGDIFSVPASNGEYKLGTRASIKIAELVDRSAIDPDGITIFTL